MSAEALFSDAVARAVLADAPAARAEHLCCRFCGSDAAGTRECCLRVAERHAVGRTWTNVRAVCCRACYRRGAALERTRLAAVAWLWLWAVAGPALLVVVAQDGPPLRTAGVAAAVAAGFVLPVLLFRAFAARRTATLLGPDRDARLRRRAGVRSWGVTNALGFRPAVPPREVSTSLDGV